MEESATVAAASKRFVAPQRTSDHGVLIADGEVTSHLLELVLDVLPIIPNVGGVVCSIAGGTAIFDGADSPLPIGVDAAQTSLHSLDSQIGETTGSAERNSDSAEHEEV